MIDYLTHYYRIGTEPFRSLSGLPDDEAIQIMKALYGRYKENILFERFKAPAQYLHDRRETEGWVRSAFIEKGGRPQDAYPISMVLGSSKWIEDNAPSLDTHGKIHVHLSALSEADVSFTFPDSMVSLWLFKDRPSDYYLPEYHGKIFTLPEILSIVSEKGMPEEGWKIKIPENTGPYIEAQVWNREQLAAQGSLRNTRLGTGLAGI